MPDLTDAPMLTHGSTVLASGVRLHHVTSGAGPRTIVLLHGYPQTWWSWRHVIGPLAGAGFRVVAPDYRGAGHSSKPPHGYDKRTMAGDIASLLTDGLGVEGRVTLVGNDIGMMVAYAFGSEHPDRVERLVLMEAVLPGTAAYDRLVATPTLVGAPMWHFFFHNAGDGLAEALTAGRERLYLRHFYDRHAFDPEAIGPADLDRYADAFAMSGAMRAGFEIYRAFDQDAADNRAALAAHGPAAGTGARPRRCRQLLSLDRCRDGWRSRGGCHRRWHPSLRPLDPGGEPDRAGRARSPLHRPVLEANTMAVVALGLVERREDPSRLLQAGRM